MKLVVCYSHGSEGSGNWTENLCVDYESKDHFLVAFIDAFAVWAEQKKQHYKLQRDLANARASQDKKKIDAAWQKWQQYCHDHQVYGPLVVDGMEFDNYKDFELNNGEYVMTGLPDVYQLEEWFELNRPTQVVK
jgi:hypothetical protein